MLIQKDTQRIFRVAIREVAVERKSRKRNVWLALAIGAAASVVAVAASCAGESEGCNKKAPAWFDPMTGAGAVIGALMAPRTVWREVYPRLP